MPSEYNQVPLVKIPSHLLDDCLPPNIPQEMRWGELLILNESLLTVIEQCNLDKKAIRDIESKRDVIK